MTCSPASTNFFSLAIVVCFHVQLFVSVGIVRHAKLGKQGKQVEMLVTQVRVLGGGGGGGEGQLASNFGIIMGNYWAAPVLVFLREVVGWQIR